MTQPYEIIILGRLPEQWIAEFEGMAVSYLPDGNTCISGSLPDQSALYGLIMRLRDLGLSLVSLNVVGKKEER